MELNNLCPVSQPLYTLNELLEWKPDVDTRYLSRVPRKFKHNSQPKVLGCHDFKGGYVEDRFIEGVSTSDCYRFRHWHSVDTFVYFSHHFVTLPPLCWIDAGHRHGVKVLGTIITEWDKGAEICREFLKDETTYKRTADQLVLLAQYYRFDGWLMNIENKIMPEDTSVLQNFLRYLTEEMHQKVKNSEVIWYDSVTKDGDLKWQNELNDENCSFFCACNGIFLNYGWRENNLQASAVLSETFHRHHDVYCGVDVFGRGTFGGGEFNTYKGMEAAEMHDLSVAIFAFGWTYETLKSGEDFTQRDEKFWNLLKDYCPKGNIFDLPLVTSFCQGWGQKYFCKGEVLKDVPWTSLSLQQFQPTEAFNTAAMQYITSDAFLGGGCLEFTKTKEIPTVKVFSSDATVVEDLFVYFTFKSVLPGQFVIRLTFQDSTGIQILRHNLPNEDGVSISDVSSTDNSTCSADVSVKEVVVKSVLENTVTSEDSAWITRKFLITDARNYRLTEIDVVFLPKTGDCVFRLGELRILPRAACEDGSVAQQSVSGHLIRCPDKDPPHGWNLKLTWDPKSDFANKVNRFHVFVWSTEKRNWHCLGHSPVSSYCFQLSASSKEFDLEKFKLDAVLNTGDMVTDIIINLAIP